MTRETNGRGNAGIDDGECPPLRTRSSQRIGGRRGQKGGIECGVNRRTGASRKRRNNLLVERCCLRTKLHSNISGISPDKGRLVQRNAISGWRPSIGHETGGVVDRPVLDQNGSCSYQIPSENGSWWMRGDRTGAHQGRPTWNLLRFWDRPRTTRLCLSPQLPFGPSKNPGEFSNAPGR